MNRSDRIAALRLARTAEIGPVAYRDLIARFGNAQAAIEALPSVLAARGRGRIEVTSPDMAEEEIARAEAAGARLVVLSEPEYPALLAAGEPAPPALFVRGRIELLSRPSIAIVGARNASANGRKLAEGFAAGLGTRGHVIVSGLARGIDAAAHRGSLETGTIAVLAGGIDQIYPSEHLALAEEIANRGALVAEMPFGHVARAADFPRRNRIIAGLALATLVVEAAERSGSLITARLAAELGREVFAVPGSPLDARCRGTNGLLRDGASLAETLDDIEAGLPSFETPLPGPPRRDTSAPAESSANSPATLRPHEPRSGAGSSAGSRPSSCAQQGGERKSENPGGPLTRRILELLGPAPTPVDLLVRETGASAAEIQAALFDLELDGLILRHPGQHVSRAV